jgi:hypothetical protein
VIQRVPKRVRVAVIAVAALAVIAAAIATATERRTNVPVAVYPSDGSKHASPTTQISFRGAPVRAIKGVDVEGSKTGHHSGRLRAHSDGRGASFLPDKPFKPDEEVTVSADPKLAGGDGNEVKFEIAEPPPPGEARQPDPAHDPGGIAPADQRFRTEPNLHPPQIHVDRFDKGVDDGNIFLAIKAGNGPDGPMISTERGRLIWFHEVPEGTSAFDFRTQDLNDHSMLTWWEGHVLKGQGTGVGVIYDDHYHQIARVQMGNGYRSDLHEFEITPQGTALMISYQPIKKDLRDVHGPEDGEAPRLRLRAHQLGDGGGRRRPAGVGAQHQRRAGGRPDHGEGPVAARRKAEHHEDDARGVLHRPA